MAKVVALNLFALRFVLVLYISPWLLFCIAPRIIIALKNVKENIRAIAFTKTPIAIVILEQINNEPK